MTKLIRTFEDNNFNNVIIPLSLDIDELTYVYHESIDFTNKKICKEIINKYKNININFIGVSEETLNNLVDEECIIDVSTSKYLSLVLTKIALNKNLPIIYLDEEEKKIKNFNDHNVLCEHLFKLTIKDIIRLGNGTLGDHLHTPSNNKETKNLVYNLIEDKDINYVDFMSYLKEAGNLLSKRRSDDGFDLCVDDYKVITNYFYKSYLYKHNLFTINNNKLRFLNKDIERMFFASGSYFEEYIYNKLLDSKQFDEVMMSVKIKFDSLSFNQEVTCELDALVLKDNTLLFVSDKSNKIDAEAINEIKVHNIKFGNIYSKPVICINKDCNVSNPSFYTKARELGVYIIDDPHIKEGKLVDKFLSIIDGTYTYDKV